MTLETAAIVVTSCGKRKSLVPGRDLCAASLRPGNPAAVAQDWAGRLAAAASRIPAHQLYKGRAFREAALAGRAICASNYVISAGVGLIPVELEIPAYSLTVASGVDNILSRLRPAEAAQPAIWWRELKAACGSDSLQDLATSGSGPVLIAAGSSYLSMIAPELGALQERDRARVRLFTAAPRHAVPALLESMVIPYDRRLEALPGRAGTLSDFAQRALRHFAEVVLPVAPEADSTAHAAAVLGELDGVDVPSAKRGASKSDAEILALIRDNWPLASGRSATMLRLLRDSFQVACGQERFKKLFAAAQAELA